MATKQATATTRSTTGHEPMVLISTDWNALAVPASMVSELLARSYAVRERYTAGVSEPVIEIGDRMPTARRIPDEMWAAAKARRALDDAKAIELIEERRNGEE